jgi:opacity protein-like surface antigen
VHAYAAVDADTMAASRSFDAVLGTSTLIGYGGGVDIEDLWKHLFVRAAVTHTSKTGTRAIFTGTEVVSLNVPRTVSMTPIELGGGWRFAAARRRVVPYVGAAALLMSYKETTPVPPADASDNVSDTFTGYSAFAGTDIGITKWLVAGAEAQYRRVPNAIGDAGLSQAFNESDLGGFAFRVTIGIRTKR